GSLTIRLCSDPACSSPLQDSGAMAASIGDTKTWVPTGLSDGTFYWQAQAQDSVSPSSWTSSRSFVIDNVAPTTSIDSSPSANSNASSGTFAFSANESVTGFQCHVDGAGWAGCTSPYSYGPLGDGSHTFYVKATADLAGNADGSPASYSWTIDATPPDTSIGPSYPALLTTATGATFDFSSNEAGSTFACSLDGASFTSCSTPKTYSALADGSHTFQVRATDTATNIDPSPASYTWTVDTTPPVTSIGPTTPPANTSSTTATFDLASNEAGSTFDCRLDGGPYASCSTPKTYTALADGSHTFDVRATDQ